jgi:acetyltransferase
MVVLKGGASDAGRRAAGSHTGSLAGTPEVYQAAFRRAGIVPCQETEEFFDAIQALASTQPRPECPTLAVLTVSGGPSVVAADSAEAAGISAPATEAEAQAELARLLPSFAALGNPVDMTPQVDPRAIAPAARAALGRSAIAGAIAVNVGLDMPEFAEGLIAAARQHAKPLLACSVDAPAVIERFRRADVPVYPTPERAVRAFRALWRSRVGACDARPREGRPAPLPPEVEEFLRSSTGPMPYRMARTLLEAHGLAFCRELGAGSPEAALGAADALGFPVVLKTARPDLLHKSEAGGVVLGLRDGSAVREACRAMAERVGSSEFVVQEQHGPATELLVGGRRDDAFGAVVAVGLGGFWAEAVRDVGIALAPLGLEEAEMLAASGIRERLLKGYRGLPAWSPAAIAGAMVAVGAVLEEHARVQELDVNPIMVEGSVAVAVDALVIVG